MYSLAMVIDDLSGAPRRLRVLLCLFVCASVAAFFAPVDEAAFAHEGEGSAVVHVSDKGFAPRSVAVDSGDTVVFENVDDEAH